MPDEAALLPSFAGDWLDRGESELTGANRRSAGDNVKVGFLAVAYTQLGGTETWHRTLLPNLHGVDVVGFAVTWLAGGDTNLLGCPVGYGVGAARQLAKSVDVLVEWGVEDVAAALPKTNRPRLISVTHGDEQSEWSRQIIERRLGISDIFVCVHEGVANTLRSQGLRAEYIPNIVRDESLPRRVRTARRVLWMARYSSEKRPILAIEIAKHLPDVEFKFVGNGPERDNMLQAASGLPNVTIAPPAANTWSELAEADLLLSTTDQEGFGYSMAEAMLAGVPVVGTPCGVASDAALCRQVAMDASPQA